VKDVILVLDTSGSMSENIRMENAKVRSVFLVPPEVPAPKWLQNFEDESHVTTPEVSTFA
jgi:hypothetical protein